MFIDYVMTYDDDDDDNDDELKSKNQNPKKQPKRFNYEIYL